jgi:hypothetical protein
MRLVGVTAHASCCPRNTDMLTLRTERPIRSLMALLPRITIGDDGRPNLDACDRVVLVQIAEAAELLQRVQVETGELDQDTVEALGWLLAEMGDASAACVELAAPCRRAASTAREAAHG